MTYASAIIDLFKDFSSFNSELHALTVYKNGEKLFSGAPTPYSPYQKNHVYSLSKSFCSTAVGIACTMGILSLDEKIVDIFPEKCPEVISENLSKMTLLNVLSMNTGHSGCVMKKMMRSSDPIAAFLSCDVEYLPGTHFAYNTGATCLAGACVTARTGLSVLEFLNLHLFRYMDIKGSLWLSYKGLSEGGVGFHVSSDDAAKLGLLYLSGGVYNGKRFLSEEYVKLAGSFISDNSSNGTPDWCSGYGLQFWRNSREGFRGDGAFGQLCMIFPEKNIVISAIAEVGEMQPEIDSVHNFAEKIHACNELGNEKELADFLDNFYTPSQFDAESFSLCGKAFAFDKNICGFNQIYFDKNNDGGIDISITTKNTYTSLIHLVPGAWTQGTLYGDHVKPTLTDLTSTFDANLDFSACAENDGENLAVTLRGTNCPHKVTYTFEKTESGIKISRSAFKNQSYACEFSGKEI